MFCPKCGNNLPDGATFCGKCGNQLAQARPAVTPQVRSASKPAASATLGNAGSYMPLVRIALGVVLFFLMFAPLIVETQSYTGMVTGSTSSSHAFTVLDFASGSALLYIVPVVIILVGAVLEKTKGLAAGRWISLAGFAILVVFAIIFFFGFASSNTSEHANAYVAQASRVLSIGWGCWATAILSVLGIASCFVKRA